MKHLVIGVMLLSAAAFGKEGGNGGGSFICKSSSGEVLSAVSQDLWESEHVYFREVVESSEDEAIIAHRAIEKLKPFNNWIYKHAKNHLGRVIAKKEVLDLKISATHDDLRNFELFSCEKGSSEFAQAAIYQPSGRILISKPIWEKMNSTNKAALLVHEAIYALFRMGYGDTDSVRSRQIVGRLMTNSADLEEVAQFLPKPAQNDEQCSVEFIWPASPTEYWAEAWIETKNIFWGKVNFERKIEYPCDELEERLSPSYNWGVKYIANVRPSDPFHVAFKVNGMFFFNKRKRADTNGRVHNSFSIRMDEPWRQFISNEY